MCVFFFPLYKCSKLVWKKNVLIEHKNECQRFHTLGAGKSSLSLFLFFSHLTREIFINRFLLLRPCRCLSMDLCAWGMLLTFSRVFGVTEGVIWVVTAMPGCHRCGCSGWGCLRYPSRTTPVGPGDVKENYACSPTGAGISLSFRVRC